MSRVTTSASAPMSSARPIRLFTSWSSVLQYSWTHLGVVGMAAAQSSMGLQPWLE